MDSKFEIPPVTHSLATTTAPHHHLTSPEPCVWQALARCSASPKTTTITVEPTKENVTIKMDGCINSDGEVSTTKKNSDSDADNVPVSMSEEEEA